MFTRAPSWPTKEIPMRAVTVALVLVSNDTTAAAARGWTEPATVAVGAGAFRVSTPDCAVAVFGDGGTIPALLPSIDVRPESTFPSAPATPALANGRSNTA